jgi:hypothetical protein
VAWLGRVRLTRYADRPSAGWHHAWAYAVRHSSGCVEYKADCFVNQVEIYNGYNIRAFESSPGKWTAEIRKVDGSPIQILAPGLEDDALDCLTTDPETVTAEAAIELAKQAVDGLG